MVRTIDQVEAEIKAKRAEAVRYSRVDPRRADLDALVDSLVLEWVALHGR